MAWSAMADDPTTIYFRPEGPGDPMQPGEVYTWDTTLQNWFDETTGGTAQAWEDGHIANVRWVDNANGAVIEVANDISLAGLISPSLNASAVFTFRSADENNPVTFTFEEGSKIELGGTTSTRRVEIENINIVGSPVISRDRTVFVDIPSSDGVITVQTVVGVLGETDLHIHLDNGNLHTYASRGMTIANLSGTGTVSRSSGMGFTRATVTLDQAGNTLLGGRGFSNAATSFTKTGAGTFIVDHDGDDTQNFRSLTINHGSAFFSDTTLRTELDATVADGATLGGTFTHTDNSRRLILSAAGSTLSPGLPELDAGGNVVHRAGLMTLATEVRANNGGTFNFYLDDSDGEGLVNSRIDFIGDGDLTLGGTKTVNLYGLGADLIQTGVEYTLISIGEDVVKAAGWDLDWAIGDNTTGYAVQSFGWDGDELQVTLIPEPTPSGLLILGGLTTLWWVRKRRR